MLRHTASPAHSSTLWVRAFLSWLQLPLPLRPQPPLPSRTMKPPRAVFPSLPHSSCLDASQPACMEVIGTRWPPSPDISLLAQRPEQRAASLPSSYSWEHRACLPDPMFWIQPKVECSLKSYSCRRMWTKQRKCHWIEQKSFANNPQQKHEFISSSMSLPQSSNSSSFKDTVITVAKELCTHFCKKSYA